MEPAKLTAGVSPGIVTTLRQTLSDPKVASLAGLLHIDLNDKVQRNALLVTAEANYETANSVQAILPVGTSSVAAAVRPRVLTPYYVAQALIAYREVEVL